MGSGLRSRLCRMILPAFEVARCLSKRALPAYLFSIVVLRSETPHGWRLRFS